MYGIVRTGRQICLIIIALSRKDIFYHIAISVNGILFPAKRIFQLLLAKKELTRQEIAANLSLSMPTTLQNVTELTEKAILEECGAVGAASGRKAKKLRLRPLAGCTLGVNIALHQVEFVLADLLGQVRRSQSIPLRFCDELDWYLRLQNALADFLQGA